MFVAASITVGLAGAGAADIELDSSFASGGLLSVPATPGSISLNGAAALPLPSGKMLLHKYSYMVGGINQQYRNELTRLNANGTPDISFSGDGFEYYGETSNYPWSMRAWADIDIFSGDDSMVVAGDLFWNSPTPPQISSSETIVKLTADGLLDQTFGDIYADPLVTGGGAIKLPFISWVPTEKTMKLDANDRIYVIGKVYTPGQGDIPTLRRYTAAGLADLSFGNQGAFTLGLSNPVLDWDVQSNGAVVLVQADVVKRLYPDGSGFDPNFTNTTLGALASSIAAFGVGVDGTDRIAVYYVQNGVDQGVPVKKRFIRYFSADGTADAQRPILHFDTRPDNNWSGDQVAFAEDGSVVVVLVDANQYKRVRRATADGKIDVKFGDNGTYQLTIDGLFQNMSVSGFDSTHQAVFTATSPTATASYRVGRFLNGSSLLVVRAIDSLGNKLWHGKVSDPVDTASGNLTDSFVDLSGVAFGLNLTRSYNAMDTGSSALGDNWSIATGARMVPFGDGFWAVQPDGSWFRFPSNGPGAWQRAEELKASLSIDAAATAVGGGTLPMLQLDYDDGRTEKFDTRGELISVANWDGVSATTAFDAQGRVSTVTSSIPNKSLTFNYDPGTGRLTSVVASTGQTVVYGYDALNQLDEVTDEHGGMTTFTYFPTSGLLKTLTDPTGVVRMDNQYDTLGRVISQVGPTGGITTFNYHDDTMITDVYDQLTDKTVYYHHDSRGRVIRIRDPFNNEVTRTYDGMSNLKSAKSRDGSQTTATYDVAGNVKTIVEPGVGETKYDYDTLNRVWKITDPLGKITEFGYDAAERIPSSVKDPLLNITTYDVVGGLVLSTTDPDGVTVTNTYTDERLLETVTTEAINPVTGLPAKTMYEYDGQGRREKVTSPSGRITTYAYNTAGFLESVTGPALANTAPNLIPVTSYTYDLAGRVLTTTDPTGEVTTNEYNTDGTLKLTKAPDQTITNYTYDDNGQLTVTTQPGGGTRTVTYGTLGRVSSVKDQLNRTSSTTYDTEGRPHVSTAPDTGTTTTLYNAAGQVTKVTDPANRETVTAYDAFGRVESTTAPGARTTTYTYDDLGRVLTATDPRGGVTTTAYKPSGRTLSVTYQPAPSTPAIAPLVTTYGYDNAGRLETVTAPGGRITAHTYNADSEIATTTAPGGLTTQYLYDPAGRVTQITDPAGVITLRTWSKRGELLTEKVGEQLPITYVYDPVGTLASVTDAVGKTTLFDYDDRGNLIKRTNALGGFDQWVYNDANELTSSSDPKGRVTTYTYDTVGRLATTTDPAGRKITNNYNTDGLVGSRNVLNGPTTTFTYTPAGQLETMTDPAGTYTYTYDPTGLPISETTATGRVTRWGYDTAGRRTSLTYPDGASVRYAYDTIGQLTTITPGETMADTFTGTILDLDKWTSATSPALSTTATVTGNALNVNWTTTAAATATLTSKVPAAADHDVTFTYRFPQTATNTAKLTAQVKYTGSGHVRVEIDPGATLGTVIKRVGTVNTPLGTFAVPGGTGTTGLRLNLTGTTVNVKAWNTTSPEPAAWTFSSNQATGVTTNGTARILVARTAGTGTVILDNWSQTNPSTPPAPVATYGYDPVTGQLTTETLVGGSRGYIYEFGRLKTFNETLPGLTKTTTLGYDATGRISTENNNGTITTYGYDTASQLTSSVVGTTTNLWTYDNLGRRSSEKLGSAAKRTYAYDEASQLCWTSQATVTGTPNCLVPPAGTTTQTYLYDASGKQTRETINATSKVDYTYDNAGQLATAARLAGTATTTQTRAYTPDGRLATITNVGTTTATRTFDWDITGGLTAPLLAHTTTTGTTRDLIGGPTGWVATRTGATPAAIGTDIHGSVLPTTSTPNFARTTTIYNAFGAPAAGIATFEPRLGYRGELQLDTLLHLRARNYQIGIGQFTARDPLPGVSGTATLTNPYHYADNTPLLRFDPTGLKSSSIGGPAVSDPSLASSISKPGEYELPTDVREQFEGLVATWGARGYGDAAAYYYDPALLMDFSDPVSGSNRMALALYFVWAYPQVDDDPDHADYRDWDEPSGLLYHFAYQASREALGDHVLRAGGPGRSLQISGIDLPPGDGSQYVVYFGYRPGATSPSYVGITSNLEKRTSAWSGQYRLEVYTGGKSRYEARAIEDLIIRNNPDLDNKIGSISPKRPWATAARNYAIGQVKKLGLPGKVNGPSR